MLATPAYLISDLNRDLDELATERRILSGMNDDLGVSFVDGAEHKVQLQMAKAIALQNPLFEEKVEKAHRDMQEITQRNAHRYHLQKAQPQHREPITVPAELLALRGDGSRHMAISPPPKVSSNRNTPKQRRNVNPPPPSTSTYYYYQSASGLPIFLHPLDIKILFSHFSSYALFPDTIAIRVEAFTEGSVNDDLRKRCKYLAHMPEGADVVFIEADLEAVVGREGLKNFEGALKLRTSRRKEKGKKDDRAKTRAEEREKEKGNTVSWTYASTPRQSPVSEAADEEFIPLPAREGLTTSPHVTTPHASGAWGNRSFAVTLSSPVQNRGERSVPGRGTREVQDDWDVDEAWHELEQRSAGGQRKRSNKLVILGGSGRRR